MHWICLFDLIWGFQVAIRYWNQGAVLHQLTVKMAVTAHSFWLMKYGARILINVNIPVY
jgi:hypothetical protein